VRHILRGGQRECEIGDQEVSGFIRKILGANN